MNLDAEAFDPAASNRPTIKLVGETYRVAETTRGTSQRVEELQRSLKDVNDDDDKGADEAVELLGEILAVTLEGADELPGRISAAWHQDAVSMETLARAAGWIQKQQAAQGEAGNA